MGFTAITKHAGRGKHIAALEAQQADPRPQPVQRQQDIHEGVDNLKKKNDVKENLHMKLLNTQTIFTTNTLHNQNIPSTVFSCFNKVVGWEELKVTATAALDLHHS